MTTTPINNHCSFRALFLLGVVLVTTLALLLGADTFHTPGFSLITFAHAMQTTKSAVQAQTLSRCASQPNAQNCTNQDPVAQGCDTDAQTLAFKEFLGAQGTLLATLERRYSPTCHAEWGRMTDNGKEPLQIIVNKNVRSTKGTLVYSSMVFVPNLGVAPAMMGAVSTNGIDFMQGGAAGQATTLPALPPASRSS